MDNRSGNKTIAKNTLFLYLRMLFTMIVSLYTSRVILQILGVDDFGIYQAVGGIVGFLSFLNSALSAGSSRFLTFELGIGNPDKLSKTFSTIVTVHALLAVIIIVVAETAGLWFLHNKMVIPEERTTAALWVFHLSVLTAFFTLTVVPYNASIISHEKMSVYAYVSIAEVVLKLLAVFLLEIGSIDKLILYAILLCIIQIGLAVFYFIYCNSYFEETRYKAFFDRSIFKEIAGFSGWSLFANGAYALNNQGVLVLINMFFSPAVVAARSISIQVNVAASQFVNNFRTAVNPQIIKKFASGDYQGSKHLLLESTKYSYYLMLLISLPICLVTYPLLKIWLGIVPDYTVVFLQIIIVQSLFQVFDFSFYTALTAKGRIKENALYGSVISFAQFPVVYLLFRAGFSPVALSWASLIVYALNGVILKPYLLIRIVDYNWRDMYSVFGPCVRVTLMSLPIPVLLYIFQNQILGQNIYMSFIVVGLTSVLSVAISVWLIGIDKDTRRRLFLFFKSKIHYK